MELNNKFKRFGEYINRYKYVALIVAIGLLLLLIPFEDKSQDVKESVPVYDDQILSFEDELREILSLVSGAGRVEVMLSQMEGEEKIYQTDDNTSTGGSSEINNKKVITITDADRNQQGLVRQIIPATYKGAIIVCEGADDPNVRLNVINAVSKITGLGADKISVLKMK